MRRFLREKGRAPEVQDAERARNEQFEAADRVLAQVQVIRGAVDIIAEYVEAERRRRRRGEA